MKKEMVTSTMKVERMSVGVEKKKREKYRDMEDTAGVGGSRRQWRRLSVDGGIASNGVTIVASSVAVVRWAAIMGMRERERVKEREKKKNEKETRG